jgi:predicted metal-dependent phosphoesterase TrpH
VPGRGSARGGGTLGAVIDLHLHSTCSDGSETPERIVELAVAAGCTAIALTDHDGLSGIAAARSRAVSLGIGFVAGCEVSCAFTPGAMHVLSYFVEPEKGPLSAELARLREDRSERNERLVQRLQDLGLALSLEQVQAVAGGSVIGRPHFAAVLVANGAATSIEDAFGRILAKGAPGYVPKARVEPASFIAAAAASGAVTVLAHPFSLGLDGGGTEGVVAELAGAGLTGLESYYGRYSPGERTELARMAKRHGLVATGGSDYHGSFKPDLHIGIGTGDLLVPDEALAELEDRKPNAGA